MATLVALTAAIIAGGFLAFYFRREDFRWQYAAMFAVLLVILLAGAGVI